VFDQHGGVFPGCRCLSPCPKLATCFIKARILPRQIEKKRFEEEKRYAYNQKISLRKQLPTEN
jgi:hypothetical protein